MIKTNRMSSNILASLVSLVSLMLLLIMSSFNAVMAQSTNTENDITIFKTNVTVQGAFYASYCPASSEPVNFECGLSNNISTNNNYYYVNVTNINPAICYLPLVGTGLSCDITIEVNWNDGTNAFSFATNGLCVVNLSTNPVFVLATNKVTTVTFHKRWGTTYWTGWSLGDN